MLGVDFPHQHGRRDAIGAPRVVDDRVQHFEQPGLPGPLRRSRDVQVGGAVGGIGAAEPISAIKNFDPGYSGT